MTPWRDGDQTRWSSLGRPDKDSCGATAPSNLAAYSSVRRPTKKAVSSFADRLLRSGNRNAQQIEMAPRGGKLVGTMGLIKPTWWYSDESFLTDRWNFCIESEKPDGAAFALDAKAIAQGAGLRFVNAQEK